MPTTNESSALPVRARWLLLKGSAIKRRFVIDIQRALAYLKSLRAERKSYSYSLHYGEHELSFGETPTLQLKKQCNRFFPCLDAPLVSFNGDYDVQVKEVCVLDGYDNEDKNNDSEGDEIDIISPTKGIDSQAEEFISRFYEEMKLQRQVSFLRYNEMLYRGMS